jgi:hypothetical protein
MNLRKKRPIKKIMRKNKDENVKAIQLIDKWLKENQITPYLHQKILKDIKQITPMDTITCQNQGHKIKILENNIQNKAIFYCTDCKKILFNGM